MRKQNKEFTPPLMIVATYKKNCMVMLIEEPYPIANFHTGPDKVKEDLKTQIENLQPQILKNGEPVDDFTATFIFINAAFEFYYMSQKEKKKAEKEGFTVHIKELKNLTDEEFYKCFPLEESNEELNESFPSEEPNEELNDSFPSEKSNEELNETFPREESSTD